MKIIEIDTSIKLECLDKNHIHPYDYAELKIKALDNLPIKCISCNLQCKLYSNLREALEHVFKSPFHKCEKQSNEDICFTSNFQINRVNLKNNKGIFKVNFYKQFNPFNKSPKEIILTFKPDGFKDNTYNLQIYQKSRYADMKTLYHKLLYIYNTYIGNGEIQKINTVEITHVHGRFIRGKMEQSAEKFRPIENLTIFNIALVRPDDIFTEVNKAKMQNTVCNNYSYNNFKTLKL